MGTNKTKATSKPKAAKKAAPAPLDPKKAYEHFLARAEALPAASVPVARVEPAVARANVDRALKAIAPHLDGLPAIAPRIDPARLRDLPALARGLEYAERLVPKDGSDGAIEQALAEVGPARLAALAYLDAAVFCGLVDAGRVRAIREGKGKLDIAQDAVTIAGLFEDEAAALAGKHPFGAQQIATLRERGGWLVGVLKPSGAVRDPKGRHAAALVKDRFAKLLDEDYAELLKAAVAIWGVDGFRARVPALQVRERRAPAKKTAEAGGEPRETSTSSP